MLYSIVAQDWPGAYKLVGLSVPQFGEMGEPDWEIIGAVEGLFRPCKKQKMLESAIVKQWFRASY